MPIKVTSPTTGTVWKIEAQVGDSLEEGDPIVILESMKMEIPVEAPANGTVVELKVSEGQAIAGGDLVALLQSQ